MSVLTSFLKLFKYQSSDDASTFNIDVSLNDNWDKIDEAVSELDTGKADTNHTHTAADVGADPAGTGVAAAQQVQGNLQTHQSDETRHVSTASKVTPVDADSIALVDSADGNKVKRVLWIKVKSLFAAATHSHSASDVTSGIFPLSRGGLNANTAAGGRETLDVYSKADVDESIGVVRKEIPSIGDIKTTIRANLGEKWVLCNGAAIDAANYPDFYGAVLMGKFQNPSSTTYIQNSFTQVIKGGNYWCAIGPGNGIVYCNGSPESGWSVRSLSGESSGKFTAIAYGSNYYIAFGGSKQMYFRLSDPTNSWTYSSTVAPDVINGLIWNGYYWVGVGDSGLIYYNQGAEQTNAVWVANRHGTQALRSVCFANNYMVAVGDAGTIYYKQGTDPSGAWTLNKQGTTNLKSVCFANNYWVAVGENGVLYYKQGTPVGAWAQSNQGSVTINCITFGDGIWMATGNDGMLYYTSDPTGTWVSYQHGTTNIYSAAYADGYWVIVGAYISPTPIFYSSAKLPTISSSEVYTYIRAKE